MSRATLYAAGPDGDMCSVKDYSNACCFVVLVWQALIDRHLQHELSPLGLWLGNKPFMKKLWQLAYDPTVAWIERVTLATTFDRALVRGSERAAVVNAYRSFMTLVPAWCHLDRMAADIEALPEETRAVGWQCTSVAENLWFVSESEDDGEGRAYNIDRDQRHFWLFDEVR